MGHVPQGLKACSSTQRSQVWCPVPHGEDVRLQVVSLLVGLNDFLRQSLSLAQLLHFATDTCQPCTAQYINQAFMSACMAVSSSYGCRGSYGHGSKPFWDPILGIG